MPFSNHFSMSLLAVLVMQGCTSQAEVDRSAKTKKQPAFEQLGRASWYGPGFHGKRTANGEIYDQNKLTAAHRSLPLGTEVEVPHVKNGKSVELRVNDRGPYVGGRVIDLSRAAAIELGIKEQGLATVKIEADSLAKRRAPGASAKSAKKSG
ncbi:MAG: septal ring lytic transglycosylase RlpA family protein [Gammaproteobacteria bacterium]